MSAPERSPEQVGAALRALDDAWTELRARTGWGSALPEGARIPSVSFAAAEERAARAAALLARIARIERDALPHELALTLAVAERLAGRWAREAARYWVVAEGAAGLPSLFAPAAYGGGFVLNSLLSGAAGFAFTDAGDPDRYLGLIADIGRLVNEMRERTAGQAERGIRIPQPQLERATALLRALDERARQTLPVAPERLRVASPGFAADVDARVRRDIVPAFAAFLDLLGPAYAAHAPAGVGIAQYPGGAEIYAELVRDHTTTTHAPHEIHALGRERMTAIRHELRDLVRDAGFGGDPRAYHAHLATLPAWRAADADAIAAKFTAYLDRIRPRLGDAFAELPRAPYGVSALPEALEATMTFGYYDPPAADRPDGRYVFNTRNLAARGLADLAALTYHELVPGHHLQIAAERESETLHPLRTRAGFTSFVEGWAEYAATLAGELGMYAQPEERFGRLASDAFLTARLVVDTGMNALGWSLEEARAYMHETTFHAPAEIASETLRYACDIPAQALAYKIGEPVLLDLRETMRAALGERFDLRDFHRALLAPGALPLDLVAVEVDRAIAAARR